MCDVLRYKYRDFQLGCVLQYCFVLHIYRVYSLNADME
jgi:hypothetical protein